MKIDPSEKTPKIISKIYGGLGNQMFQYAAGLSLAKHLDGELLLDLSPFETYKLWGYGLNSFCIPQNTYKVPNKLSSYPASLKERVVRKLNLKSDPSIKYYKEPHFHFDAEFYKQNGEKVQIDGYFQSPQYFQGVADELHENFQPAHELSKQAQAYSDEISKSKDCISLHVRRGDYVRDTKTATVHTKLSIGYYQRSIDLYAQILDKDSTIFLFSDEPDVAEKELNEFGNIKVVRTDPERSWEDMYLMSKCDHHIIANSSYSWWGAWLNQREDKKVIAPASWFTPAVLAKTNVNDLFPENWIVMR